jgi:nucleotide-binding universal stress UspA family protein
MRLLLAIDDSKFSYFAVREVSENFFADGTEVLIVHAVEPEILMPDSYVGRIEDLKGLRQEALARGEELLEESGRRLKKAGFRVETVLEECDARSAILGCAENWRADLIVLGCHGRKAVDRMLMGSVSDSVMRHANCSVLIVKIL